MPVKYLEDKFDMDDPGLFSTMDELPLWSAPFGIALLEKITMKPGMRVLDLGCGTGFPLTEIAQRLGPSSAVFGIDPWGGALLRAKDKIKIYGLRNAHLVSAAGEKMPFQDSFFGLIVANNGINNVRDMGAVLSECARTCRKGGQMVLTMNLEGTMAEFYGILSGVLEEKGMLREVERMKALIYSKRRPLGEMRSRISAAGFRITSITEDFFTMRFADGSAMLNHFFVRLAFVGPWKSLIGEKQRKSVFLAVERRMNARALERGELRMTVPFAAIDCARL